MFSYNLLTLINNEQIIFKISILCSQSVPKKNVHLTFS